MRGPGPMAMGQMGTGIRPASGPGPSWYMGPGHRQAFSGHVSHPGHHVMQREESESSFK